MTNDPHLSLAVLNCSGNVGKTTLTRQLLAPRLPGHAVAMMESINADEAGDEAVEVVLASEASRIHERLLLGESLIVDVGASNVEEYLHWLEEAEGAQTDFGLFIVPVVPANKQMADTIKTIALLAELGVQPERIRVVFNMVRQQGRESVERMLRRDFAPIVEYHEQLRAFDLRPEVVIPHSAVFSIAAELGMTVHAISQDRTDYRSAIAAEKPGPRRNDLVRIEGLRRLAAGMEPRLQVAFEALVNAASAEMEQP
jgi:hypothetical protein